MTASEDRNKTEHIVEQRRSSAAPTAYLHTPAPSLDEEDILAQVRLLCSFLIFANLLQSVTTILTEIKRLDLTFSLTGSCCAVCPRSFLALLLMVSQEITGVGLDTWHSLQMNHVESLNCKSVSVPASL
jgi:hypothetical protein